MQQLALPMFDSAPPAKTAGKAKRKPTAPTITFAPAAPAAPAPDPAAAYLERMRLKGYSIHTLRSYECDLRKAREHFGRPLLDASEIQVEAFLAAEMKRGLHPTTVGRRLNTLRSFYKDARRYRLIVNDPTVAVDAPKKPRRLPKYLKDHEVDAMLAALRTERPVDLRERAMLLTLYHTGMRLSEMINLDVAHVAGDTLRVYGKGNRERELPIPSDLRAALDDWIAVHPGQGVGALFTCFGPSPHRLHAQQSRAIIKGVFRRAGLNRMRFTPHSLRHTLATRLLNKGMRIDVIQRLLGHSGIATTQIYSHTEFPTDLRAQMEAIMQRGHVEHNFPLT